MLDRFGPLGPFVHFLCCGSTLFPRSIFRQIRVPVGELFGILQRTQGLASWAGKRPDNGDRQDPDDHEQGGSRAWLMDWHVVTIVDKRQGVLAQRVQDRKSVE